MIIKIVNMQGNYKTGALDVSQILRDTYVVEAKEYKIKQYSFTNKEQYDNVLASDFGEYYTPFGIDVDFGAVSPFYGQILWLHLGHDLPIVATRCALFIMNDSGKTVDKIEIA